ncbi:amino acid permease [Myxococcota bacterium]|nr:amino acid permease [Myxococcota bacterium]
MQPDSQTPRRTFSIYDSIAIVVGIVIGAGIFTFPTLIAMNVSSGWMLAGVWLLGGLVSFVGVLCYAELATTYPDAGGDYHFLSRGLGARIAFIFAWTRMMVIQPGSIVMMAFIIGRELTRYFPMGSYSDALWAGIIVSALTALNLAGVKNSNATQKALTLAILGGLLLVFVLGALVAEPAAAVPVPGGGQTFSGFGMAMVFVLLTFGGWNEAAYISSEIRDPDRNIVRSLLAGITVVTLVYLLVNFALFRALGLSGMRSFDAYHAVVGGTLGSGFGALISGLVIVAALSTANVTIITGARSNFAFGRDFGLLRFLGSWNEKRGTPTVALLFQAGISFLLILLGVTTKKGLQAMVDYTSPAFWCFFLLTGLSLFLLRRRDRDRPRPFRVPLYPLTPILFVLFCAFMLRSSLLYTGRGAWVSVAVMASGALALAADELFTRRRHGT